MKTFFSPAALLLSLAFSAPADERYLQSDAAGIGPSGNAVPQESASAAVPDEEWIPIEGGGRFRVHDVTFGTEHLAKPLNPGDGAHFVSTGGKAPWLAIWVHEQGAKDFTKQISSIRDLEMHLSDGQVLLGRTAGSGGGNVHDRTWRFCEFLLVPWRERELDVRFTLAGRPQRLRITNPAYQPDLPRWEGQPLPQTRGAHGLAVTLKSLELKENPDLLYYGLRWAVRPAWTVALNGSPADKWFRVGGSFEDPGGNRSTYGGMLGEPAWKVKVSVSRSYAYPFPPGEVRWFGRIDPAYALRLPEGRCELLDVNADAQARGIYFAGVFAPGEYKLKDGKLISSGPPARRGELNPLKSTFEPETNTAYLSVSRTLFIRHVNRDLSKREQAMEVWLSDANEAVYLGGQGSEAGDGFITHQELGKKAFRYGLAKNERVSFEMMVPPPTRPRE